MWYANSCGVNAWDNNKLRRDFRVAHLDNPCTCGIFAEGYCANLKSVMKRVALNSTMVRGKRVYKAQLDAPKDGSWVAFFIDFKFVNKNVYFPFNKQELLNNVQFNKPSKSYPTGFTERFPDYFGGLPHDFGRFYEFSTQVSVFPNTFPYPDCEGAGCGERQV